MIQPAPFENPNLHHEQWLAMRRRRLEAHVGVPFSTGNSVQPLHNGVQIFPAMLEAIRGAQHHVNFLTYIFWKGKVCEQFADALSERAGAGVEVRVLLDALGAASIPNKLEKQMRDAGVRLVWFRRPYRAIRALTHRTHRKILVCDGEIGFTGGVGIAEEWDGDARTPEEWRDIHFAFRGQAVDSLNGSFWENWTEACPDDPPIILPPRSEENPGQSHAQVASWASGSLGFKGNVLLQTLLTIAEKRLTLVTPYLAMDRHILRLLASKAKEGVDIRLLLPGPHTDVKVARWESERYFGSLMESGTRIFIFQPTMMHSKLVLADEDLALCGSLNLNQRSLKKDEETAVLIQDERLVTHLDAALTYDFERSKELSHEAWGQPTLITRALRTLLLPFKSHL